MSLTDREKRYITLRESLGCFNAEATEWSKIDLSQVPYFQDIEAARRSKFIEAKRKHLLPSAVRYRDFIYDWYVKNGWTKEDKDAAGRTTVKADPWKLWRHFERQYKGQVGDEGYYKPSKQKDIDLRSIERNLKMKLGY